MQVSPVNWGVVTRFADGLVGVNDDDERQGQFLNGVAPSRWMRWVVRRGMFYSLLSPS